MKFKGTKGPIELKFVGPICIGIGTSGAYAQMTANTIIPETDEEYSKEKEEIEGNMKLYAAAPELLEALQNGVKEILHLKHEYKDKGHAEKWLYQVEQLIKKALE